MDVDGRNARGDTTDGATRHEGTHLPPTQQQKPARLHAQSVVSARRAVRYAVLHLCAVCG